MDRHEPVCERMWLPLTRIHPGGEGWIQLEWTHCLPQSQHLQQAEKEIKLHTVYAGISEQVTPELVGQAA